MQSTLHALSALPYIIVVLILIVWILVPRERRRRLLVKSRTWPTVDGVVIERSPETHDARGFPIWWVRYSYKVDGIDYVGQFDYVGRPSLSSIGVSQLYSNGQRLQVRYDPSNPSCSAVPI